MSDPRFEGLPFDSDWWSNPPKRLSKEEKRILVNYLVEYYTEELKSDPMRTSFPRKREKYSYPHQKGRRVGPKPALHEYDGWTEEYLPGPEKVQLYCASTQSYWD